MMEYIKVNLPASYKDYQNGNGEGVWMKVGPEAKKAYDTDESDTQYEGILDNVSVYYPNLQPGDLLPIEMRGEFRPVVPYAFLNK